jgi:hypothetical protein
MGRFKEPSTWAALSGVAASAAAIPPAAPYAMGASLLFGMIGMYLKEEGNK